MTARTRPGIITRFERRQERLLPARQFVGRLLGSALIVAGMVFVSLLIGVLGYHWLGHLQWIDAVLNASMILGGMGPVDRVETAAGKLFASGYALYSGFALLTSVSVLLAPVVHRFLHHFHLETEGGKGRDG
jgi:hypothetical protein